MCLRSASARSIRASRQETQSKRNKLIYEIKLTERRLKQAERREEIARERLRRLLEDDDEDEDLERMRRRLADLQRAQQMVQQELRALLEGWAPAT